MWVLVCVLTSRKKLCYKKEKKRRKSNENKKKKEEEQTGTQAREIREPVSTYTKNLCPSSESIKKDTKHRTQ